MIRWSIRAFAKNVSCVCNVIEVSKCKRLSNERIDDRIKKNLNPPKSALLRRFPFLSLTILSKNHYLANRRQSVRRLLRATHSIRRPLVLPLVVIAELWRFEKIFGSIAKQKKKCFSSSSLAAPAGVRPGCCRV